MSRATFLELAARRLRMPIGADLILHRQADPEAILLDGSRLGRVIEEAAGVFGTPLAFPVMDLKLEKRWLLSALGIAGQDVDSHHLTTAPDENARAAAERRLIEEAPPARVRAQLEAIGHIVRNTALYPVGMSIGPFSLASKLLADPITPVFLAGTGATAADEPEVALLDAALALARAVVLRSVQLQVEAGARAVFIAEPAANLVFFSPKQLEAGADIFERYALSPNRDVATLLAARGVDHLFHCCGEITNAMLDGFCSLRPVLLSLGSSRRLWEDAARVPADIVLYGNLPSKRFYSDELTPLAAVATMADDLEERMAATGHPFILGTECDTLHVPGCGDIICGKVERMLRPRAVRVLP
jgi:uroporphyrinogen-III decarboxylase